MAYYMIALFDKSDRIWIDAAKRSHGTPKVVLRLLSGESPQRVKDSVLDAVVEWDRALAKHAEGRIGIDYWPASDIMSRRN